MSVGLSIFVGSAAGRSLAVVGGISKASSGFLTAYANLLMFIRFSGVMLSPVLLPATAPQPRVMAGNRFVVMPTEPCGVGVLQSTRIAGMRRANSRILASSFE